MRVFIGNLPADFSSTELRKLACRILMSGNTVGFFGGILKKSSIIKRSAFEIINSEQGYNETPFAVIFIEPDKLGHKLIQRLDRYFIRETVLVAREFHVRAYINDRRAVNWRGRSWDNDERRLNDRRIGIIHPNRK